MKRIILTIIFMFFAVNNVYGLVIVTKEQIRENIAKYEKQLKSLENNYASNEATIIKLSDSLSMEYLSVDEYDKAIPLLERVLKYKRNKLEPNHPEITDITDALARAYDGNGNHTKAISLYTQILNIVTETNGNNHTSITWILNSLGNVYRDAEQYDNAERCYLRSWNILKTMKKRAVAGSAFKESAQMSLGKLYVIMGDYEKAEIAFKTAIAVVEEDNPTSCDLSFYYYSFASFYRKWGYPNKMRYYRDLSETIDTCPNPRE